MKINRSLFLGMVLTGMLTGFVSCGRFVHHHHSKSQQYTRVSVDTTAHDDFDKTEKDEWQEEPIFEDVEYDGKIKDKKGAMDEYNKFVRGEPMK